ERVAVVGRQNHAEADALRGEEMGGGNVDELFDRVVADGGARVGAEEEPGTHPPPFRAPRGARGHVDLADLVAVERVPVAEVLGELYGDYNTRTGGAVSRWRRGSGA